MKKTYLFILVLAMASIAVCSTYAETNITIVGVRSKLLFEKGVVYSPDKTVELNVMVYTDLTESEAITIIQPKGWRVAPIARANWLRNEAVGDAYVSDTGTYNEVITSMVNDLAKQIGRGDIMVTIVEKPVERPKN